MKILPRAKFLLPLIIALAAALPLARVEAGGKPRVPPKPVYNAISSVDAAAHTITYAVVNSQSSTSKTVKISERTEIEVNGQKATLGDLKAGMQVNVELGMDETIADRITAKPAPAEPTPYPTPNRPSKPPVQH